MVVSIITLIWVDIWPHHQSTSAFRIAPMGPYLVLVTILTSRVHRNTKLGLYNTASQHSSDPKSQPHAAAHSWNSQPSAKSFPITVTNFDGSYSTDYSTTVTKSRGSVNSLDFGMV